MIRGSESRGVPRSRSFRRGARNGNKTHTYKIVEFLLFLFGFPGGHGGLVQGYALLANSGHTR